MTPPSKSVAGRRSAAIGRVARESGIPPAGERLGHAVAERVAQVAGRQALKEAPVLHEEWVVQAHALAHGGYVLVGRRNAQHHARGVADLPVGDEND